MTDTRDPRLLTPEALAAIVHNAHVATQYLLRHDALSFELGKTSLDDTTRLYAHVEAQAAMIARLRAVAEAARAVESESGPVYVHGLSYVDSAKLARLREALAALAAGGEAAGEGEG